MLTARRTQSSTKKAHLIRSSVAVLALFAAGFSGVIQAQATATANTKSNVNIRTGMGKSFPVSGKVAPGDSVSIIGTEGAYLKVRTQSGKIGYVVSKFFRISTPEVAQQAPATRKLEPAPAPAPAPAVYAPPPPVVAVAPAPPVTPAAAMPVPAAAVAPAAPESAEVPDDVETFSAADLGLSDAELTTILDSGLTEEDFLALDDQAGRGAPGIAMGSPVGMGSGWGSAGMGLAGATNSAQSPKFDGSASFVFGMGDAEEYVSLETSVTIISLTDRGNGDSFAHDGNVSLHLSRSLSDQTSIAIGADNLAPWGLARNVDVSSYVVATHIVSWSPSEDSELPIALNLGLGNKRFANEGKENLGVFGGFAVLPTPSTSLIADWTGSVLNAGISWAPFTQYPLTILVGGTDVTARYHDHAEFSAGIGYGFEF